MIRLSVVLVAAATLAACQQASAPSQTASCAAQITALQNSGELTVQGGGRHQNAGRSSAQLYIQQASDAAARGDERACLGYLGQAKSSLAY